MTSNERISDILYNVINRTDVYLYSNNNMFDVDDGAGYIRWGRVEKDLRKVVEDAVLMERNRHICKGTEQRIREALENDRN